MCFNELITEREKNGKICDEGKHLIYGQTFLLSAFE